MKSYTHELPREALELVAARFRVLSEPLRLAILQSLGRAEKSVTELSRDLRTSQPNVSKHLRVLAEAGLISRRARGTTVVCAIADESVFALCDLVCGRMREQLRTQAMALAGGKPRPRRPSTSAA